MRMIIFFFLAIYSIQMFECSLFSVRIVWLLLLLLLYANISGERMLLDNGQPFACDLAELASGGRVSQTRMTLAHKHDSL